MHSLLILTVSFASMCGYLNWATQQTPDRSMSLAGFAKVIRVSIKQPVLKSEAPTQIQQKQTVAAIPEQKLTRPLDLSVSFDKDFNIKENLSTRTSQNRWFEQDQEKKVSYNARLLFDAKNGTNIRGGLVNITIPLG